MKLIKSALLAAATVSLAMSAQARELKFATSVPAGSLYGDRIENFAAAVERLSEGALTVEPFFSSSLGDEQTVVRQTVRGRIDMAGLSSAGISLVAPEVAMVLEPYLFESNEHAICVINNHITDVFAESLDAAGLVSFGYINVGRGATFSSKDVSHPDDFAGLQLRATPTPAVKNYVEALGSSVVTAGVADMVPMLQTGAIDGADTTIIFGVAVGLPEFVENMSVNGAFIASGANIMSSKTWNSLSEEEQGWLKAADEEARDIYHAALIATEDAVIEYAKSVSNVSIFTEEQSAPFREIAEAGREEAIALYGAKGAEIWGNLQAALEACSASN